jgi:hypothetical protein
VLVLPCSFRAYFHSAWRHPGTPFVDSSTNRLEL